MALPKPSTNMDWTDGDAAKQVEPSAGKKLLGWVALERPPFEYMNFLFYNTDLWVKYLESITDETANNRQVIVNASGDGQFTDLQSAHDDAGTVAGTKLLVTSDLSIDTKISITKADIEIEFRNGKRLLKGGGAPATNFTGIEIGATADRVRMKHCGFGRAGSLFSGAGDVALDIIAGATDVFVDNPIFGPGNTTDLQDNGTDTVVSNAQVMSV